MSLLSMTDCSVADNRVQARYELDAAANERHDPNLAAWAKKWGRALIDYAEDAPNEDDVSAAVCDAEARCGNEIERIRAELAEKIEEMRDTLRELENI